MTVQELIDQLAALPDPCKGRQVKYLDREEEGSTNVERIWPVLNQGWGQGNRYDEFVVCLTCDSYDLSEDVDTEGAGGMVVTPVKTA